MSAHLSRALEGNALWARCSICNAEIVVPNKGLGRATLAAWESRHQHHPEPTAPTQREVGRSSRFT